MTEQVDKHLIANQQLPESQKIPKKRKVKQGATKEVDEIISYTITLDIQIKSI